MSAGESLDIAAVPVALLAGGLATRLRPITEKIPKALVEVSGRPFIDHQLELLRDNGIRRVVLCVGYLGEMLRDHLGDGDRFELGSIPCQALHTPGHTPACMTYVVGDAAFVGDTLFMPDYGTARCDFPGGDARALYRSIRRIFALPDATRLFLCHDYKAPGRDEFRWETTVGEEKRHNVHVHEGIGEDEFVAMRTAKDKTLGMPRLILPSVQVNMRAGQMPPPEDDGRRYLKIPVDSF